MVEVRVADEQNANVAVLETQLFDALPDLRRGRLQVGIDENVALRRDDQIGRQIAAAGPDSASSANPSQRIMSTSLL